MPGTIAFLSALRRVARTNTDSAVDGATAPGVRALLRTHAWALYLGCGAVLTAVYLFGGPLAGSGPLINLLGLSSPIAIFVGVRMHRPRAEHAWAFFVIGQFLFFAGDFYTYSYPKLFGADVPFPSLGDAIYLTVYPALMAGLLVLVRRRSPGGDRAGWIDSLILTVGIALLSWVFLIAPSVHLSGLSALAKGVSVAYPFGDVLLLGAAIRLAVDRGKRAPAFYLLVGSIVCLLTTDSIYTYALLNNAYHHQLSFDVGWILYYLLWGAAALHPSMRTLDEPASDRSTRLTTLRLRLLAVACLMAPGIRFVQEFHQGDALVIIAAAAGLFLLVLMRMAMLVRQEERAVSRELALRGAGIELVAAPGREHVHAAAISSVRRLVGDHAGVRLVLLEAERGALMATTEDDVSEARPLSTTARSWFQAKTARFQQPSPAVPATVRHELRIADDRSVLVLPLSVRDETRGALAVCSSEPVPPELADSLEALATQVSLALESASLAEDLHRRKSEARFRSLVAHSTDLITVLDGDGIVTYQSPSIERVLGYAVDDIRGTPFARLVAEADRPRFAGIVGGAGAHLQTHTIECSLRHRDGAWLQFEMQHTNLLDDEHVRGIVLNSRDVSERKEFEAQLAHQAFHDEVTSLANRALFADRVQQALTRTLRNGDSVAVMFIDLDEFKTINDSLGHAAGDLVLLKVARRLEATVRPTDTVARFGGDEFAVLLDGVDDLEAAADVAERILRVLEEQVTIDGKEVFPRASLGICLADAEADAPNAEELLRNADVAMYMAKRDSKGGYRVFEREMHERVLERLELRAELQRAIESEQLEVHYQPVVRLDERVTYGVEALLRWRHPTRGNIPPLQFIPLAEETGLIIPLGRWVLQEACRQGAHLQSRFSGQRPLTMSVNLSLKQVQSETILDDVRDALESSGLPPSSLVLEITESVMMADKDLAIRRLNDLKALGVRLAMDDFGTGYSSLSYLSAFPVDILKMDRAFVGPEAGDYGFASTIIALGQTLGLDVIAEGIEEVDELRSLLSLGCEFGQGYHFAAAMDRRMLAEYLDATSGDEPAANAA